VGRPDVSSSTGPGSTGRLSPVSAWARAEGEGRRGRTVGGVAECNWRLTGLRAAAARVTVADAAKEAIGG
jgi:hypothetical protein